MRPSLVAMCVTACLMLPGALRAEQKFDPAARAGTIAPFIDEATFAVVRLDPARLQTDPLVDLVLPWFPQAGVSAADARSGLGRAMHEFAQAGGRDVYLVLSLSHFPQDIGFVVIPLSSGADEKALATLAAQTDFRDSRRVGNCLVAGRSEILEGLESLQPDARPELAAAFEAAGDTAFQLVLTPPKHSRRVIEELMPTLPEEIGGGPSMLVTRGVLWAAVGVDGPPRTSLRVVVQSQDAQAAAALRERLLAVLALLGKQECVAKYVPKLDALVPILAPEVRRDRLVLELDAQSGIGMLLEALRRPLEMARAQARRVQSMNNLKQIGLAMHMYHDRHKAFPAPAIYAADGKPLLSWRVQLLPYLGQEDLYKQFRLDEPWDSPANRPLVERIPAVYRSPSALGVEKGRTTYVVPVGESTVFPGRTRVTIQDITDGTSNTIMAVETSADRAVFWTQPEDLPFDPQQPDCGLAGTYPGGFLALFCDGSVQFLSLPQDAANLRGLFTRAGGEAVSR